MHGPGKEPTQTFWVGPWLVDPSLGECRKGNGSEPTVVHLTHRQMDLLCYLAKQAGKVVTKQELIREVWRGSTVSDDSVTTAIYELRRALGKDPAGGSFIETLPRRGYRLVTAARSGESPAPNQPFELPSAAPDPTSLAETAGGAKPRAAGPVWAWRRPLVASSAILLGAFLLAMVLLRHFGDFTVEVGEFSHPLLDHELKTLADALPHRIQRSLGSGSESTHYRFTLFGLFARSTITGELSRAADGRLRARARLLDPPSGKNSQVEVSAPDGKPELLADQLIRGVTRLLDEEVCDLATPRGRLRAEHCYRAGRRLLLERRYGDAVERLARAHGLLEEALNRAPAERRLGRTYTETTDLLANALDIIGQSHRAAELLRTSRGRLQVPEQVDLLRLERREAQIRGDAAREHDLLVRLRDLDSHNADWRYRYGWFLRVHRRDCTYALQQFQEALDRSSQSDPDVRATFWSYSGSVRLACGEAAAALADFERYLELRSDSPDAWDSLAGAELEMGLYAQARTHLNHALVLDPAYGPARLQKGQLERDLGHFEDARREYRQFLADAGDWPNPQCEGLTELARLEWMAGNLAASRDLAQAALVKRSDCISAIWVLGLAAVAQGDTGVAHQALTRLDHELSRTGSLYRAEYRHHLAALLAEALGDLVTAIALIEKALALRPAERCFFLGQRAALLARNQRWAEATQALAEIRKLNPNHPRCLCLAGTLTEAEGHSTAAMAYYRQMLDLTGETVDDPVLRDCLERFRRFTGSPV